ncbi:MAG: hypothetical protein J5791_10925 [Fibrobacter sp.]|nr:hypothetical protein [Fibrobacter sp.]
MKLNSSSFILVAFLCAVMSVDVFADSMYGYRCSANSSEGNPQQYTYVCSIAQYESVLDFESGYEIPNHWTGMGGFQEDFNTDLATSISNCRNEYGTFCEGVEIRFETDLDLGGFEVAGGDTTCVTEFAPIYIPYDPSMTQIPIVVNGQGNTIRGFCNTTDASRALVSFFQGYGDYDGNQHSRAGTLENAQIKNLRFDGVYLKATGENAVAGVVAAQSSKVDYSDIYIQNAKVIAENVAGGIIGIDTFTVSTSQAAQTISTFTIQGANVDVEIDAPIAGGLVGRVGLALAGVALWSNTVSAKFRENESGTFVGGLVGMAAGATSGQVEVQSVENNVLFEFEGLASNENILNVGGVVGFAMSIDSVVAENSIFDVRISAANDQRQRLGGIVGFAQLKDGGRVRTGKNHISGTIASTGTGNSDRMMGGIVGFGRFTDGSLLSNQDSLTISLNGSSEGNIYAGGIVGNLSISSNSADRGKMAITSALVKAPEGEDLISISSSRANALYAGGLVGYVSTSMTSSEISKSRVEGNIRVSAEGFDGSGAVGGLVGESYSMTLLAYENVSAGNILASIDTVGFVIGSVVSDESSSEGTFVYANLHYGTGDANAASPLGALILGATAVESWDHGSYFSGNYNYNVSHNYRNAIESGSSQLSPTGKLKVTGTGAIVVDGDSVQNGVISESEMTSRLMTYVMNQEKPSPVTQNQRASCWENETGSLPHVCANVGEGRTVYRVNVDISDFYSELSEDDKSLLEPYLHESSRTTNMGTMMVYTLVAYTESNGQVDREFAQRVKALTTDMSRGVVDGSMAVDLEMVRFYGDYSYSTGEDRVFDIVYEFEDPEDGTIKSLDDAGFSTIYLWPKVTRVSRFGDKSVVPPVFLMLNETQTEVYATKVTVTCDENSEYYDICQMQEQTPFDSEERMFTFSEAIGQLYEENNNMVGISSTLHVIYTSEDNEMVPRVNIVSGEDRFGITLKGYGYKDGELYSDDYAIVTRSNGGATKPMYSRFSAEVERGFIFKNWKVDLWVMNGEISSVIEQCYDFNFTMGQCVGEKVYEASGANFTGAKDFVEAFSNVSPNGETMVWSTELDSDEMLNMDSFAVAIVEANARRGNFLLFLTPEVEAVPYAIDFDVNAGDFPVFVGGYTDSLIVYSREDSDNAKLPTLYSTGACFNGWGITSDRPGEFDMLSGELLEQVEVTDNVFSLYGSWAMQGDERCEEIGSTRTLALQYEGGSDRGEIYFWQRLINPNGDTLVFRQDFDGTSMEIPEGEYAQFLFHVGAKAKPGYVLDSLKIFWNNDAIGGVEETVIDIDDPVVLWNHMVGSDATLVAKFAEIINVDLVLNTSAEDLFYDLDFTQGDPLEVRNTGDQMELPTWIYTTDACVTGWSFYADVDSVNAHVMTFGDRLYKNLYETRKMYAVWRDAQICVDSNRYVPVTAESENGSVELVEYSYDGRERVHRFGADGSLILPPSSYAGEMVVQAVPARGYVLDSIVMVEGGKPGTIGNGTMISYGPEGFELRAYFSESGEPLEDDGPVLVQSGNAVRFSFPGVRFVRNSDAWVHFTLENDDGDSLEDTTVYCSRSGCYLNWEKYPLKSGNYLFTAQMYDGADTSVFERDFEVANEIAGGESWHMVSLSNVKMDELSWDGDEKFFWWAEDRNYGKYWQYQELTKGQVPDPECGYWYSSIEGRPLVLKDDFFDDENVTWTLDSVNSGWNLVANPYGWYIELGVEHVDSAVVLKWVEEEMENPDVDLEWLEDEKNMKLAPPSVEFWRWDEKTAQYVPADTLKPYEAVWAKVNKVSVASWPLSASPVFVDTVGLDGVVGEGKSLNKAAPNPVSGKLGWTLQVVLSDANGKMDSWNTLGAGKFAWKSEEPPAGMGDRVNLSIVDGGKRLAKSVKVETASAAYEWNVELSATSARNGFLEISGIAGLEARGLNVYVEVDGKRTRMQDGVPLKVALTSASKSATVYVGGTPKVALSKSLEGLRAVQAGAMLQVGFVAGEGLAGSAVRVDVLDLKGNVVRSAGARAQEGANQVSLDAPKPGIYMLRVRAGSQMRAGRILVK